MIIKIIKVMRYNDLNRFNVKVEEKKEELKIDMKEEINIDNLID